MQFDWTVFTTTLLAGLALAFAFWCVMRHTSRMLDANRLERKVMTRHQYEISELREKVEALERQVNALKIDIDVLHDSLMKDLREPPRR